ncbi:putative calcium ATPase [Melanogaster broomeanus]|nr:putative calcium ATPase [Melanogaster broomeanus]
MLAKHHCLHWYPATFVGKLEANQARTNAAEVNQSSKVPSSHRDFSVNQSILNTVLPPQLPDLFNTAIAINSTAFEDEDPATKEVIFLGSKTEMAPLNFAKELKWHITGPQLAHGSYRLYVKGASEILTSLCIRHVIISSPPDQGDDDTTIVETAEIGMNSPENISRAIIFYANQTLRTIAVCYRDFRTCPPPHVHPIDDGEPIEHPLPEGVREAAADCQKAGVAVKVCTGDNVLTACSISSQCAIFMAGGVIMQGPIFRQLNDKEMLDIVPSVQVLAHSSPEDKKILVEKLHALGEGANDGFALKTTHVITGMLPTSSSWVTTSL